MKVFEKLAKDEQDSAGNLRERERERVGVNGSPSQINLKFK